MQVVAYRVRATVIDEKFIEAWLQGLVIGKGWINVRLLPINEDNTITLRRVIKR